MSFNPLLFTGITLNSSSGGGGGGSSIGDAVTGSTPYAILRIDGSGNLDNVGPLTNGQLLIGSTGAAAVAATITGTSNQISVANGAGSITLSLPQSIATSSSPTFNGLTLGSFSSAGVVHNNSSGVLSTSLIVNADVSSSAAITVSKLAALTVSSPVRSDSSGFLTTGALSLATEVTGVLSVAHGGTNSSASLNNNRIIISSGGAIVESSALTTNKALATNSSGLPVASATTDTELGYVSGVTSAIQTQLNNIKQFNIEKFTLSGTDITNGFITLVKSPSIASLTLLDVVGGIEQDYSIDFSVTGSQLSWTGLGLDGILISGDKLIVQYN